ncbi:Glyoxalase bleomycin resistance protein dioxygenase [Rhizoctonia solani]
MAIDHVSNGSVSDLQASKVFYEKALAPLGYKLIHDISPYAIGFGTGSYKADFWLSGPDPNGSRTGEVKNTMHIAFAGTRAQVHAFHEAAIQAGGKCNGAPGFRPQYHPLYYGSFILDPDGNNVEVVNHGSTWQWIWYFAGVQLGFIKPTESNYKKD